MINIHSKRDEGSALVFVLVMIVLLSLWFAGLATLTQSAAAAVKTNTALAIDRQEQMQGAFAAAMSQMSGIGRRIGTDADGLRCEEGAEGGTGIEAYYPYPNDPIAAKRAIKVEIECTQITQSGLSSAALASFALVGTNTANCATSIGSECGLAVTISGGGSGSSACATASTSSTSSARLAVTGGLLNVSGQWSGVDCTSLSLIQNTALSTRATIKQTSDRSCPDSWYNYTGSGTSWTAATTYATTIGQRDCTQQTNAALNPSDTSTEVGLYLLNTASALDDISGSARFIQTGTSSATCANAAAAGTDSQGVSSNGWKFLELSPGVIDSTMIDTLNTLTGSGSGACSNTVIVFTPGVYRFRPTAGTPKIWTLNNSGNVIIAGKPNYAALPSPGGTFSEYSTQLKAACVTATGTAGVQWQFANDFQLAVTVGALAVCADNIQGKPAISAPNQTLSSAAGLTWYSNPTGPLISTGAGTASSCRMCVAVNGLMFAPAGYASVSLNGKSYLGFEGGAVLKAFNISVSGSVTASSSVAPPPPSVGDRVLQLRFRSSSLGDLGVVQVVIKDYFGRRLSSGYKIIGWRAAW